MSDREFSDELRQKCSRAGIDIEDSYARMQASILDGSSNVVAKLATRLAMIPRSELALSPQETRVLEAFMRLGYMGRVAAALGIDLWTVDDHLEIARSKLDARNSLNAVAIAIRRGLIQPPPRTA